MLATDRLRSDAVLMPQALLMGWVLLGVQYRLLAAQHYGC